MNTRQTLHMAFGLILLFCSLQTTVSAWDQSGRRHIQHFNPANPRPDFFPHTIYNAWVPYRKAYNRPSYIGGHIAAFVEPTSQEAMAWHVHRDAGSYRDHRPGFIPTYYYPKPWESLPIQPRPNEAIGNEASVVSPSDF